MKDIFTELENSLPGIVLEAPPGKLVDLLKCLRVLISNDEFFFRFVTPVCLEYHLQHSSVFNLPLTSAIELLLPSDIKTSEVFDIQSDHEVQSRVSEDSVCSAARVIPAIISLENHLVSYAKCIFSQKKQQSKKNEALHLERSEKAEKTMMSSKAESSEADEDLNVWDEIDEENNMLTALENYIRELKSISVSSTDFFLDENRSKSSSKDSVTMTEEANDEEDFFADLVQHSVTDPGLENVEAVFFDTRLCLYIEIDPVECRILRVFPFSSKLNSCILENQEAACILLSIEHRQTISSTTSVTSNLLPQQINEILLPSPYLQNLLDNTFCHFVRHQYQRVEEVGEKSRRRVFGVEFSHPKINHSGSFLEESMDPALFSAKIGGRDVTSISPPTANLHVEVRASFQLLPAIFCGSRDKEDLPSPAILPESPNCVSNHDEAVDEGVHVVYGIFWESKKEGFSARWRTTFSVLCHHYSSQTSQRGSCELHPVKISFKGHTNTRFFLGEAGTSSAIQASTDTPFFFSTVVSFKNCTCQGHCENTGKGSTGDTAATTSRSFSDLLENADSEFDKEVVQSIKHHLIVAGEQMKHAILSVSTKEGWETFRCRTAHPLSSFFLFP